jgi:hypothetical protein
MLVQVKSYMSHYKTCAYGVATDGNEMVVIDKDFEHIPAFDPSMLPQLYNALNPMILGADAIGFYLKRLVANLKAMLEHVDENGRVLVEDLSITLWIFIAPGKKKGWWLRGNQVFTARMDIRERMSKEISL